MRRKVAQKVLSVTLSILLAAASPQISFGYQSPSPDASNGAGSATDSVPQSASQLQALVAPIALYPDALVAQVLAASTFPDQVAVAEYWMQQNKSLTGTALMQAVDKQSWDPSVKALTQFPSVLDNLSTESQLDVVARGGLSRPGGGCDDRDSDAARSSQGER